MVSTTQFTLLTPSPLLIFTLFFFSCVQMSRSVPLPYHSSPSFMDSSSLFPLDSTTISNNLLNSTSTSGSPSTSTFGLPSSSKSTTSTTDPFRFSYFNHPIYSDPYFLHSTTFPHPVIISRYYRHVPSIQSRRNDAILFAVGVASYQSLPTPNHKPIPTTSTTNTTASYPHPVLLQNLDALVVSAFGAPPSKSSPNRGGVEAYLTSAARVFVLLYGNGIDMDHAQLHPGSIKVTGLKSSEWNIAEATTMHISPQSHVVVGDRSRVGDKFKLPSRAVVVETTTPVHFIRVHHPSSIKVNGKTVKRYCILFAKPDSLHLTPTSSSTAVDSSGSSSNTSDLTTVRAFPYPTIPVSVPTLSEDFPYANGTQLHITNHTTPIPNRECPAWLHNLWRAPSRNTTTTADLQQPTHWRTWHPSIDPVYWCYYSHEHGAYPGLYKPLFGYTAWNNPDNTTHNGRQYESHEGFKVFSFPVTSAGRTRYVVITVHMHLAVPRRFSVRHHTVIFAVLDERWNLEMELQMKMDFGAAMGTLKDKSFVPMDAEQKRILDELQKRGRKALRRINILNIDDGYPNTVDREYLLSGDLEPTTHNLPHIMHGIYEKWSAPLTTCMQSSSAVNSGLTFDVRNPSTGVKTRTTSAVMYNNTNGSVHSSVQYLSGDSGDRMIVIPETSHNLEIGIEHCHFDSIAVSTSMGTSDVHDVLRTGDGVFYTDPYMKEIVDGGSDFSVRQYISTTFETIRLPKGKILTVDSWASGMDYGGEGDADRHFMNSENAVKAESN